MRDGLTLPRAAIPYLYRKHLTWDVQTIIIQPQNYRKWADFICNKLNRTKLFNDESRPAPQNRCMLTDYLIRKPIVLSVGSVESGVTIAHNAHDSGELFAFAHFSF